MGAGVQEDAPRPRETLPDCGMHREWSHIKDCGALERDHHVAGAASKVVAWVTR
jgi:hypothetical protein